MNETHMRPDRCETCHYWDPTGSLDDARPCHAAPPTALYDVCPDYLWPLTPPWEWCGLWTAAVNPPNLSEGPTHG